MRVIANVRVGKPQVSPSKPSHVRGVRVGNKRGAMKKEGFRPSGEGARAGAKRSTGINPSSHEPIDPRMPKLSPS